MTKTGERINVPRFLFAIKFATMDKVNLTIKGGFADEHQKINPPCDDLIGG